MKLKKRKIKYSHILHLLVCPVGISGGWSPEIPDIGGLLRLLRIGGGEIHKRKIKNI